MGKTLTRSSSGIGRWFGHGANILTYWPLIPVGAISVVSYYLSKTVEWISLWGVFGWWSAALLSGLAASLLFAGVSLGLERLATARAARTWGRQVDKTNPLDQSFERKRLKVSDLAHPVKPLIKDKRFTDCQLVGPATIVFTGCTVTGTGFVQCDIGVFKEGSIMVSGIGINDCHLLNCEFIKCTVLMSQEMYDTYFASMSANIITYERPKNGQ